MLKKLRIGLTATFMVSLVPWFEIMNLEMRTNFLNSIFDQGGVSIILLFIFTATYLVENILKGVSANWLEISAQFIGLIFFGSFIILSFIFTNIWEDKVVYKQSYSDEYLILQHFTFGVTGSRPEWRIIRTSTTQDAIRKIFHIDKSNFSSLNIETWEYSAVNIPKLLLYENKRYELFHEQ